MERQESVPIQPINRAVLGFGFLVEAVSLTVAALAAPITGNPLAGIPMWSGVLQLAGVAGAAISGAVLIYVSTITHK